MPLDEKKREELTKNLQKYGGPAKVHELPVWITNTLYGSFKCGKTVAAARIPNTLLFACDKNWISIKDYPELADVEVQLCQGLKHFEAFILALLENMLLYREFKHIMVDPINMLIDEKLDWLSDNYTPPKTNRDVWNVKPGRPDNDARQFETSGASDYRVVRDYFRKYLNPLCNIEKHITFICHVRNPHFLDKGPKHIRPALPDMTWQMLARQSSLISYMEVKEGKHLISFETDKIHDGGSCFKKLHGRVINAEELPELYKKYEKDKEF